MTVYAVLSRSEERLEMSFLGEFEEGFEDCIFVGILEVVVDNVHCDEYTGKCQFEL